MSTAFVWEICCFLSVNIGGAKPRSIFQHVPSKQKVNAIATNKKNKCHNCFAFVFIVEH